MPQFLLKFWEGDVWSNSMLEDTCALNRGFLRLPSHHDCLVLYAQLLHPSSVQLLQQTHDAGLLPRARRTVNQQVWEVATLNLKRTFTGFNDHS